MQTAADAAAIAGDLQLERGGNHSGVMFAADASASLDGFTNDANGTNIIVNNPPATGAYAGDTTAVEVIISQPQPTYFLHVLNIDSVSISVRAVAHPSAHDCIYALSTSASNALVVSGAGSINANCGVAVNSSSSSALLVSGGACISASSIVVSGGASVTSCTTPTPITNAPLTPDPYAWAQPPTIGGCTYTNYPQINSGISTVLNPGVYCGGITISGNGVVATLNPGTYILEGGRLTVSGGASLVGDEVTFYNTANATYSYKPIVYSGGSSTSLSAPTSGPLAGILFFQDRSIINNSQNTISGGSGGSFRGALYFPTTRLVVSGGSSVSPFTTIVGSTITISGPSYASLPSGSTSAMETAVLGE